MTNFVEAFKKFNSLMENHDLKNKREVKYEKETGLVTVPGTLEFLHFKPMETYAKVITISNVSIGVRKFKFFKAISSNDGRENAFDADHVGVVKLYPGCSFQFRIKFNPYDRLKYDGALMFISYDPRKCQYFEFKVPLRCTPACLELKIYPQQVDFGTIPIWKARDNYQNYKHLIIRNISVKKCKIFIQKATARVFNYDAKIENVDECVRHALEECLDNLDNYFRFESNFLVVPGGVEMPVKIYFKNAEHIGKYMEKYVTNIYEDETNEIFGYREIYVKAETTGHLLSVLPEVLDFKICRFNSCYQQSFQVYNGSRHTQTVSLKIPYYLEGIVQSDVSVFYIHSHATRVIWIKLLPRIYVVKEKTVYFDPETSILEFPIRLTVASKIYKDYPPAEVTAFAILTNSRDLALTAPTIIDTSNIHSTPMLDLGVCSVYETVSVNLVVTNNTLASQICGFLELPTYVTIRPNFGFLKLFPHQQTRLKMYVRPELSDFPDYPHNEVVHFKIALETLSNLGGLKMEINPKRLKKSMEFLLKEMVRHETEVTEDMRACLTELNKDSGALSQTNSTMNRKQSKTTVETSSAHTGVSKINYCNEIWCKMEITRPLLKFSHQVVVFPDTPCGSYSVMEVTMSALPNKMYQVDYRAHFKVAGDNKEIIVEPNCGNLECGQRVKITLVAMPEVPEEILRRLARSRHFSLHRYVEDYESGDSSIDPIKNRRPVKENMRKQSKPSVRLEAEGVEELRPTEMIAWRSMEPYYIKAHFRCHITYDKSTIREEALSLQATCRVIRPDFITNLASRCVDFGKCLVGQTITKRIQIQNIKYEAIEPTLDLLNPLGPFSIPFIKTWVIQPEHVLDLPIKFSPDQAKKTMEYVNLKSGPMTLSLMLTGEGVAAEHRVLPSFIRK